MSNDPALDLAMSVGSDPLKIFLSISAAYLDESLGRLEAILLMRNRTVADVLELKSGTTIVREKIQVVCTAFRIWKGLHTDLVKKYENVTASGADPSYLTRVGRSRIGK